MQLSVYDVFAPTPYAGNQAAIVRPSRAKLSDPELVAVAGELALAETALLGMRGRDLVLRFATAAGIIDRCGHATLAGVADHVLTARGSRGKARSGRYRVGPSVAPWQTRPITDRRACHYADGLEVAIAWPDRPQFASPIPARPVCRALGLDVSDLAPGLPRCIYNSGNLNALVPVGSFDALRRVAADWARMKDLFAQFKLTDLHVYCVQKTRTSGEIRLFCRNLFPYGVLEESATGTASVALATALIDHMRDLRGGRDIDFNFDQGIGRRRGTLRVRWLSGMVDSAAIWLEGRVFRVLTGELRLPSGSQQR